MAWERLGSVTQFLSNTWCDQESGRNDFSSEQPESIPTDTSETEEMKLYTVYSPPNHKDGTIHATKAEAEANEEHFDGQTTE